LEDRGHKRLLGTGDRLFALVGGGSPRNEAYRLDHRKDSWDWLGVALPFGRYGSDI
jgi:hypothetical protein